MANVSSEFYFNFHMMTEAWGQHVAGILSLTVLSGDGLYFAVFFS